MNAANFGKVAVLMGGTSAEREVSLRSGGAVLAALQSLNINAGAVDPTAQVVQQLQQGGFERAFMCLHGRGGEDGVIQGALDTAGIPYTGSGVLGSALSMDKYRCKLLWQGAGLPTPAFMVLLNTEDLEQAATNIGFPLMVKPAREGSSIGMARANNIDELRAAWNTAREYDDLVIVERWISGKEYTCAILAGEALPMIRLETPRGFYDYTAKYNSNSTLYHCPCGLEPAKEEEFQELALKAFVSVGASGWGRVDLLTDADNEPWLLEVNTAPGMTDHSLVPMAARAAGMDFPGLVLRILQTSVKY